MGNICDAASPPLFVLCPLTKFLLKRLLFGFHKLRAPVNHWWKSLSSSFLVLHFTIFQHFQISCFVFPNLKNRNVCHSPFSAFAFAMMKNIVLNVFFALNGWLCKFWIYFSIFLVTCVMMMKNIEFFCSEWMVVKILDIFQYNSSYVCDNVFENIVLNVFLLWMDGFANLEYFSPLAVDIIFNFYPPLGSSLR